MEPFTTFTAIAVPIDEANVDTNQLCPTRFNKVPVGDEDYWKILMHDRRFNPDGSEKPEFILNREPYRKAGIIVADRNWGGGSSRESAVYSLKAFGIRSVIASSFGDIHYSNCMKNGVLPAKLPQGTVQTLRLQLHENIGAEISIDLEAQTVTGPDGVAHEFEIPENPKYCLLNGLDDIARTQEHQDSINAFRKKHTKELPFLIPERSEL